MQSVSSVSRDTLNQLLTVTNIADNELYFDTKVEYSQSRLAIDFTVPQYFASNLDWSSEQYQFLAKASG